VNGSSDETELAANGFEIVGVSPGVWVLAGSTPADKSAEVLKSEEVLMLGEAPTDAAVPKDSASRGVFVTRTFAGVAIGAGTATVVAAAFAGTPLIA
jgi:hypothetical protein